MASNFNDGGPAFPSLNPTFTGISSDGEERWETEPHGGMTLRDYFAAHAPEVPDEFDWKYTKRGVPDGHGMTRLKDVREKALDRIIRWRYSYADAMIGARKQGEN